MERRHRHFKIYRVAGARCIIHRAQAVSHRRALHGHPKQQGHFIASPIFQFTKQPSNGRRLSVLTLTVVNCHSLTAIYKSMASYTNVYRNQRISLRRFNSDSIIMPSSIPVSEKRGKRFLHYKTPCPCAKLSIPALCLRESGLNPTLPIPKTSVLQGRGGGIQIFR